MSAWPHKLSWNTDEALRQTALKLQRGSVLLVLGAGLSMFYRLPNWRDLLSGLENAGVGHRIPEQADYEQWAQDILDTHFGSDEDKLKLAVANGLYGNPVPPLDEKFLRSNETLRSICAMGTSSMRGKIDSIVTFNYDSLLENYYAKDGLIVRPITRESQIWEKADVNIYHPHGFLPHPSSAHTASDAIVLTKRQYSRAKNSNWEHILEHLFSTRFCIFVGVSGADDRLKRIMSRVNRRNEFAYRENYWGYRITTAGDRRIPMWERRGVFSKVVGDFDTGIPETLYRICQLAADQK